MKSLRNLDAKGSKRVLVRCDFNVPLDEKGNILDDFRIRASLPTIEYLLDQEAKIILMSHLGDPGGIIQENLRLSPIGIRLVELLGREVEEAPDCIGSETEKMIQKMKRKDIILLENLRFYKGEEENDIEFARLLAKLGDVFVQDAFGACHRSHASVVGLPRFLPAFAGLLLEKEIAALDRVEKNPSKPLVVIIGGKKIETKAKMIQKFAELADWVLVGNLIAKEVKDKNIEILRPEKVIFAKDAIFDAGQALDIGPGTIELFSEKISQARTIFWNGPLGKIEEPKFVKGTQSIAASIIKSGSFSVVGGGETVEFINRLGLLDKFSHVSTGGGAMLAYLSGEELPGLKALGT